MLETSMHNYNDTKEALKESRIANKFLAIEVKKYKTLVVESSHTISSSATSSSKNSADVCSEIKELLEAKRYKRI